MMNPFNDQIVPDPRRPEPAVAGLNDGPLHHVLAAFGRVAAGEPPRPLRPADQAVLVTSEQPGYGKSHLIGRIFRALHGDATLVYVQPFQNARTAFQSLMLTLVREMHFPDRASIGSWNREEPSQLDALAHAVLGHLLADLAEGSAEGLEVEAEPKTVGWLRKHSLGAFQRGGDPWAHWLSSQWEMLQPYFDQALAHRGLELENPSAWLRVLRTYAFAPTDVALRRACLDWISGQPVDPEEMERIGLRSGEAVSGDASPEESNTVCRTRLIELCQLATFHRPLVFCFDQTEVYGHHPALARAFGMVVATLVHEARGHLTMITANQDPWTKRIAPHLETADLDRIARPPLALEGLKKSQAIELAKLRLQTAEADATKVAAFLGDRWLSELFPNETNELGARRFLQKCKERWDARVEPAVPLAELFEQRKAEIIASPKRHSFEPDALQWLVEVAARGLEGVEIEPAEETYFTIRWKTPERICLFGFIPGSFWKQWRAIARASVERNRASGETPTKCVLFRAPGQPLIPGEKWSIRPEIETAQGSTLHIIVLTLDELAGIYAARDLYADGAQGDIVYTTDEVLAFLRGAFEGWWTRLRGPVEPRPEAAPKRERRPPEEGPGALGDAVRTIVEKARFLSVEEVLTQLNQPHLSQNDVLAACGFFPEIRVHSHPNMTVLQWQRNG